MTDTKAISDFTTIFRITVIIASLFLLNSCLDLEGEVTVMESGYSISLEYSVPAYFENVKSLSGDYLPLRLPVNREQFEQWSGNFNNPSNINFEKTTDEGKIEVLLDIPSASTEEIVSAFPVDLERGEGSLTLVFRKYQQKKQEEGTSSVDYITAGDDIVEPDTMINITVKPPTALIAYRGGEYVEGTGFVIETPVTEYLNAENDIIYNMEW